MKVILDQGPGGARVLALGTFDGVHLGHQALLKAGKEYARTHGIQLRVCSFDRHPLEVLRPEMAPAQLTTAAEKEHRVKEDQQHWLFTPRTPTPKSTW